MTRSELAALVSRALAVFAFVRVPAAVLVFAGSLTLNASQKQTVLYLVGSCLVWLIIGLALWFKAGSLGTWVSREPPESERLGTLDRLSVSTALIQAVAVYNLVWSASYLFLDLFQKQESYYLRPEYRPVSILGHSIFLGLVAIVLLKAQAIGSWLCKR